MRAPSGRRMATVTLWLPLLGACTTGAELMPPLDSLSGLSIGETTDPSDDDTSTPSDTSGDDPSDVTTIDPTSAEESSTTKPDDSDTDVADGTTGAPIVCGDGTIAGDEQCDGEDLGGEDCVSQGFVAGALACKKDCTFDTATCATNECGNGALEDPEQCEGMDLGGETCQTQGFTLGVLACAADCTLSTAGCNNPSCGNDVVEQGEVCDGEDLGGESCVSLGNPGGGSLVCVGDCSGYDTGGCACFDEDLGTNAGPAITSGNTGGDDNDLAPSCGGADGPDRVIEFTATAAGLYAFDTFGSGYDTKLALFSSCQAELACNDDSGGVQSRLERNMAANETVLVVVDGYNGGSGAWVLNIAAPGAAFPCQDQDIGGATGASVASGNTGVADNDLDPSCGLGNANDQAIRFVAPAAAQYTFDTFGSSYDTVLSVWSDCSTQTSCNDDSGVLQSEVILNLAQGEAVIVLVDGYNGATGNWVLNVTSG